MIEIVNVNYNQNDSELIDYLVYVMKKGLDSERAIEELKYTVRINRFNFYFIKLII